MIDFQERVDLKQASAVSVVSKNTTNVRNEGIREYLDLGAAIASGIIVLFMAGSSIFALGLALGRTVLAYGVATLFVVMAIVFIGAFWSDYLPSSLRRYN